MNASEIRIARDRKSLTVVWDGGGEASFSARQLRRAGRSADAVRARIDGITDSRVSDLAIVEVKPVGGYAVNIVFSDGYHRGIYPFAYLAQLQAGTTQQRQAESYIG
jgi:DUF971 family protein